MTIQTPNDKLQRATNDYSLAAQEFTDHEGAFVDLWQEDGVVVGARERERRNKVRDMLRRQILYAEKDVPTLAVIVNVARSPQAFRDVLGSLARQTFVEARPELVEVILVQDGSEGVLDEPDLTRVLEAMDEFPRAVQRQAFRLGRDRESRGRGTARNVGIRCVLKEPKVIMFVDDAMILDRHFVVEQMLRHMYVTDAIALLGFKENRRFRNFVDYTSHRETMKLKRPDFRTDWKWTHKLKADEATIEEGDPGFDYEGRHYEAGSTISYMQITDNFKTLRGNACIGHRALPMFFHTGLTSVTYRSVRDVGGFEKFLDVGLWGLEDSYLGLLLAANGVKLVPCPSSVAYKVEIEDEEVETNKILDIELMRDRFWDSAKKQHWNSFNSRKLEEQIDELKNSGHLERVSLDRAARQSSGTRTAVPAPVEAPPRVLGLFATSLPTVGNSEYEADEKLRLFGGRPDDLSGGFTAIWYAVATHSFDRDRAAVLGDTIRSPGAHTRSFTIRSLPGAGLSLALAQLVRDLSKDNDKTLFWVIDDPELASRVLSGLSEEVADSFYSYISACSPCVEHAVIILDDVSKMPSRIIRNLVAFRERCKSLANERRGPRVTFIFGSFGAARTCSEDDTFELELTENDQERCYEQMRSIEPQILLGVEGGLGAILRSHPEARWYENDAQAFIDFLLEYGRPTREANKHWLARTDGLDDTHLAVFTTTAVAQLIGLPIEEAVVKRLFASPEREPLQDVEQVVREVRGLALIQEDWKGLGLSCARRARSILERTDTFRFDFLSETFSEFLHASLNHFKADGHGADRTLEFARHIFQRLSKHPLYRFNDDLRIAQYLFGIHLDNLSATSEGWNVVAKARWAGTLSRVLVPAPDAELMDDASFSRAVGFVCGLCEDASRIDSPPSPVVALGLYRASRVLLSLTTLDASRVHNVSASRVRSVCFGLQYAISTEAFLEILHQVVVGDVDDSSYRANELVHACAKFENAVQGKKDRRYCEKMNRWYAEVEQFFNKNHIAFDAGSWLKRADDVWIDTRASVQKREGAVTSRAYYLKQACDCVQHYPYNQGTWWENVVRAVKRFVEDNPDFTDEFPFGSV